VVARASEVVKFTPSGVARLHQAEHAFSFA
jgi:hypothetical protein